MNQTLAFFQPTPGGRNVVEQFLRKDLKNRPGVQDLLVDKLKVLEQTPISTLREQRVIGHVRDEIFEARFQSSGNWVRLLLAMHPTDRDIVILLPLLKAQNRLDPDDIKQAQRNLVVYKTRFPGHR